MKQDERGAGGKMELLAPAGNMESLEAALEAGADAVYFGLRTLNARRGARNFGQEEFAEAVAKAHARGAKAYLTLNIDLAQREIGQAARILELARRSGVDAVLVRDPALLVLRMHFPEVPFHFSTQTCMASSADVRAARELGASRVVLARELTLGEIAAASAVEGVETEVFAQGALCFSVSGRCLLASWVGGRSGNRGACTSPCRVPWNVGDRPVGTPMSMRDLVAVHRVEDLAAAGVKALKIEGRLKTPGWVGRAVSIYRRALAGEAVDSLVAEAAELGAVGGRLWTSGYLDGERGELTGVAARRTAARPADACGDEATARVGEGAAAEKEESASSFDLRIEVEEKRIACRCSVGEQKAEWEMPKTVVHRAYKAVTVGRLLEDLGRRPVRGYRAGRLTTNEADYLLVPRAANALEEKLSSALAHLEKEEPDEIRIDLPAAVREDLGADRRCADNDLVLGEKPDRVRIGSGSLAAFVRAIRASGEADALPDGIVVEGLSGRGVLKAVEAAGAIPIIAALPPVFFEEEIAGVMELLSHCAQAGVTVEVNSWGGWALAREANLRMEAGPGMGVLNSMAARALKEAGMECVTLSMEADRKQLEDVCAHCPVAASLVVFGRPALMISRAQLAKEEFQNRVLTDRRGVKVVAKSERGLWVFRPAEPFDWRTLRNEKIRVRHLVVDLVGEADAVGQWLNGPDWESKAFRFNYSRTLY